jgi:hypothetical protein
LGVSSRGLGTIRERDGVKVVMDDFMLATAADIVADPSAPETETETEVTKDETDQGGD